MVENILKKDNERINLSKPIELNKIINIEEIINYNFNNSVLKINGFNITKKERYYFVEKGRFFKEDKIFQNYNKIKDYENVLFKYNELLRSLKLDQAYVTADINELVLYIYFELIFNLELAAYKHNLNIDYEQEKSIIHKILGRKLEYSHKKTKKNTTEFKRSTLLQRASMSKYWNRETFSKKLEGGLTFLLNDIKPLEAEFPQKYDKEKLYSLLKDFAKVLNELKIENRNFELRFKKLGLYKKKGMYFKNSKTLIIDPRHSRTIFHELGHYIHETNTPFYFNGEKITKRARNKIIKANKPKYKSKFNNHRIEELDVDSETFAYWLEDTVRSDILK